MQDTATTPANDRCKVMMTSITHLDLDNLKTFSILHGGMTIKFDLVNVKHYTVFLSRLLSCLFTVVYIKLTVAGIDTPISFSQITFTTITN